MTELLVVVGADDIRSGKNTSGAQILAGTQVMQKALPTVAGEVTPCTGATVRPLGVAMNDIEDGEWGEIQIGGVAKVLGGGVVAVGVLVTSDATGKGVASATTNVALGIARTLGAATGYLEVELAGPGGTYHV